MMSVEKEVYYSDTLSSDHSTSNNSSKINHENSDQNKSKEDCVCQQRLSLTENSKYIDCPAFNSKLRFNSNPSQCFCQKSNSNEVKKQSDTDNVTNDWQNYNWKWPKQSFTNQRDKAYEAKSKNKRFSESNKQSFSNRETLEGIPKKKNLLHKYIIENPIRHPKESNEDTEKIEIYYFDHGNSAYYHTTDIAPILWSEKFAEKSNSAATKFWAEIFGYVHIGSSFLTAFLLQLLRCILFSLIRPLTVGVIQIVADYFLKPILSIIFNGIVQPILILFYNIATSVRDCCEPLAAALGFFIEKIAMLFGSCRLIEIIHNHDRRGVNS